VNCPNQFADLKIEALPYEPVEGKTYSLFGSSGSTGEYYLTVKDIADHVVGNESDIPIMLNTIRRLAARKHLLRKVLRKPVSGTFMSELLHLLHDRLSQYTIRTDEHLKHLPAIRLWDRRLGTTREQYHLYMIEIEITNRFYRDEFMRADRKIALLPYCLQDFSASCKATVKGFDYQCNHCSKKCFENQASIILKQNDIEPYIWRGSDFKKLAAATAKNRQKFAVFGIACIPELVWGMRKCRKHGIPVLGLPLNANRCVRWFGEFYSNSLDINELKDLL
jgi:hypothetical protein